MGKPAGEANDDPWEVRGAASGIDSDIDSDGGSGSGPERRWVGRPAHKWFYDPGGELLRTQVGGWEPGK